MLLLSPDNKEELFNLRHAQARNIIERIFGVLKRRFRILLIGPEYSVEVQAKIPAALCAIHNFIRLHDDQELDDIPGEEQVNQGAHAGDNIVAQTGIDEDGDAVVERRDLIAQAMWNDYQIILQERQ
jgi:hypothetical protein